jgi:hypothetical protein
MRSRNAWLALFLGLSLSAISPETARASVSIAVTWDGLLHESTAAALVTALESRSAWEGGRIYTYTHVRADRVVAGSLPSSEDAWVRTMGGIVDKIGQSVEGEAVLGPGTQSLLFLHAGPNGALEVTARGQGQFPVVPATSDRPARVVRSHATGALVTPQTAASAAIRLAADVLHDRALDDVAAEIAAGWSSAHAH